MIVFALEITDGLDRLTNHDAIAAAGPVDLLQHPRGGARVSTSSGANKVIMSTVPQSVSNFTRRERIACNDGVVDEHHFDFDELLRRTHYPRSVSCHDSRR